MIIGDAPTHRAANRCRTGDKGIGIGREGVSDVYGRPHDRSLVLTGLQRNGCDPEDGAGVVGSAVCRYLSRPGVSDSPRQAPLRRRCLATHGRCGSARSAGNGFVHGTSAMAIFAGLDSEPSTWWRGRLAVSARRRSRFLHPCAWPPRWHRCADRTAPAAQLRRRDIPHDLIYAGGLSRAQSGLPSQSATVSQRGRSPSDRWLDRGHRRGCWRTDIGDRDHWEGSAGRSAGLSARRDCGVAARTSRQRPTAVVTWFMCGGRYGKRLSWKFWESGVAGSIPVVRRAGRCPKWRAHRRVR